MIRRTHRRTIVRNQILKYITRYILHSCIGLKENQTKQNSTYREVPIALFVINILVIPIILSWCFICIF